jgi:hypothetical protein
MNACKCGHGRAAHMHYRKGTECGSCDCSKFREPKFKTLAQALEAHMVTERALKESR